MSEKMELGLPKTSASSLKEQAQRKILRTVRSQGHPYVELRETENGRRFIFFCTLCLAPCYGDTALFHHLKGNIHAERLAAAKVTLLLSNPWPFNDGIVFFDDSVENDSELEITNANQKRLSESNHNDSNLAIVKFGQNLPTCESVESGLFRSDIQLSSTDDTLTDDFDLVIPHVLISGETIDVKAKEVGLGKIAARFFEKDRDLKGIRRIWCEWLGKEDNGQQDGVQLPDHDFALVIFSYRYEMGRMGLLDEVKSLPPSAPVMESKDEGDYAQKRKKSLSNPEDISDSLSSQYDSSMEDSSASNSATSSLVLEQYDNQLLHNRFIPSKAVRKEMRKQQRLAAEKMCDICKHKMLPGKDVATLLNLKTGRLACSSRNGTGAFHVFHTSCLIHWILLCEYEIITNSVVLPNFRQGTKRKVGGAKRKNGANVNGIGKQSEVKAATAEINKVFCPECQGSGMIIKGDGLEHANFNLSEHGCFILGNCICNILLGTWDQGKPGTVREKFIRNLFGICLCFFQMFKFKIKASDARREWMKCPEVLHNCSTGFHFPSQSEAMVQEEVAPLKLLRFYRVDA